MENTALYVDYYLKMREIGYTHETALKSTVEFMDEQFPALAYNDLQITIRRKTVMRVCCRIARMLHPEEV